MPPFLQHRDNTLFVNHSPLVSGAVVETYLTAQAASGGSTITAKNITGFAVNQVLLLGELGQENAEIILTHASSAPSGTTVTLASNLVRTHEVGTRVRVLLYNQFEVSHASTATGSKTVLTVSGGEPPSALGSGLIAIDPTRPIQTYFNTEQTTGYFFARYKDSIAGTFSGYCDAVAFNGLGENTVGFMIEQALRDIGVSISDKISKTDCHRWVNDGLRLIKGKIRVWPEHTTYNYVAGQTSRGVNSVTMPSDAYDTETESSLLSVRIGTDKGLIHLSPGQFDAQMEGVAKTQVRTQATSGATTLEIDNSYDFEDSGSVNVYISGTKYSITYTGVTRSATAGVLTGIPASGDGSISVTIPVDTNVWQGETEGKPVYRTVRNGALEFWPLADSQNDNKNVCMDYSLVATDVDSDGDTIDYQRYDMVQSYLTWRIECKAKKDGMLDKQSGYYTDFKEKLNDAIRTLPPNRTKWAPNINSMSTRRFNSRPDVQDLDVADQ